MSNAEMDDLAYARYLQRLAAHLGLTVDELESCDWEETQDEGRDGELYGTVITFRRASPPDIVAKVKGLNGSSVNVPPHALGE